MRCPLPAPSARSFLSCLFLLVLLGVAVSEPGPPLQLAGGAQQQHPEESHGTEPHPPDPGPHRPDELLTQTHEGHSRERLAPGGLSPEPRSQPRSPEPSNSRRSAWRRLLLCGGREGCRRTLRPSPRAPDHLRAQPDRDARLSGQLEPNERCPVCLQDFQADHPFARRPVDYPCGHRVHQKCFSSGDFPECPQCWLSRVQSFHQSDRPRPVDIRRNIHRIEE